MVSRRRILSRSRDDLNLDSTYVMQEEEEDVWYQRDKLYKVRGNTPLRLIGFCLPFVDFRNSSVQFHIRIPRHSSEVNNQLLWLRFPFFSFYFLFFSCVYFLLYFDLYSLSFLFLFSLPYDIFFSVTLSLRLFIYLGCMSYSVVGTATRYELDGSGIKSRCRINFPHSGPNQPPVQWLPCHFLGKESRTWR